MTVRTDTGGNSNISDMEGNVIRVHDSEALLQTVTTRQRRSNEPKVLDLLVGPGNSTRPLEEGRNEQTTK
jgi:hypothetical protein